jgi:hypothetical protein
MKTIRRNILKVFFTNLLLITSLLISSNLSLAYEKEVERLSGIMIDKISKSGKQLVAVVDFNRSAGNTTELGRFLAEEFSCALSNNNRGFDIIERIHLKNILEEHKLSLSGMIDLKTAQKIGEISGIEALVMGTITPFRDSVKLQVKLLDTITAKIIGATRGNIPKTRAIEELLEQEIETPVAPSRRLKAKPHTQHPKGVSVEAEGFTFTPVRCTRGGGTLKCTILFTNKATVDRELGIKYERGNRKSFLSDDFGQKYYVQVGIGGRTKWPMLETFPPGVPEKVDLIAENVSLKATHMTAVISIKEYGNSRTKRPTKVWKMVVLKNIPITN